MYLPVSFNEVNHCALCLFSLCLLSKWEDYPCLQNFAYSTMNPLELLSKIQFSLSKELNIKCMNKIVKKEVLEVCTGFPLITTCRKNTLYFHFLPNWASQQSPRGGGRACSGLVRGKFSPPLPILSRFLTVPNSSCIIDPWGQLQNLNTGRNSYRRAQRAVELSTP